MTNKINERGITLVALVITIVVLIILSTVTISTVLGDNGLINQAKKNKNNVLESVGEEEEDINKVTEEYANMMKTNSEVTPPTVPQPIEDVLKEGDYVNYKDAKGKTRKCVVLYGPENTNYSSYGIQIIAMESVEDVTLGSSDFNTSRTAYNNAISTLNKKAREYNNPTYSTDARCVGSVPDNPDYDGAGMYVNDITWFQPYSGTLKDSDNNYISDINQINSLKLELAPDSWLASREVRWDNGYAYFFIRYIIGNGPSNVEVCQVDNMGKTHSNEATHGIVPVYKLKYSIKVVSGEGSKDSPYELGE